MICCFTGNASQPIVTLGLIDFSRTNIYFSYFICYRFKDYALVNGRTSSGLDFYSVDRDWFTSCNGVDGVLVPAVTSGEQREIRASLAPGVNYFIGEYTYYIPDTKYCILHNTYYILHTTSYILHTTYYMLHITYYIVNTTYYILHITYYILQITYYILHRTYYILQNYILHQ